VERTKEIKRIRFFPSGKNRDEINFFVKILKTKQVERKKWWVATRAVFNIYFRLLTYTLAGYDLTTHLLPNGDDTTRLHRQDLLERFF
jgi:hypothetical protein